VFFIADDGGGTRLWKSDGTENGTVEVKNLFRPGIYGYAVSNGRLYFDADDGSGRQLWKTDGTTAGTKRVTQIGSYDASPRDLTDVSGVLYFNAIDDLHGLELWKSDGTKASTQLVKDVTPGVGWTSFFSASGKALVSSNGKLYFSIYDPSFTYLSLWQSNGTEKGTHPVHDRNLTNVTFIGDLTPVNKQLFFSGYSYTYGWELYEGNPRFSFPIASNTTDAITAHNGNKDLAARLISNPVQNQLKFTVNVKEQQAVEVIIMDVSGRVLKSEKQTLSSGTNVFLYDANAWTNGMYIIRIVSANGISSLLKAIK
jgi:ELWxxDGT repeat protein